MFFDEAASPQFAPSSTALGSFVISFVASFSTDLEKIIPVFFHESFLILQFSIDYQNLPFVLSTAGYTFSY